MALLVPDEGENKILSILLHGDAVEDLTLKLYTNAGPPAEGDVAATYTEPSGNGYAAISLPRGAGWTVTTTAGVTKAAFAQQTFTFTGGPVTINGYFIVGATSGKLYWAEAAGAALNILATGGSVQVTPQIQLD